MLINNKKNGSYTDQFLHLPVPTLTSSYTDQFLHNRIEHTTYIII